MDYLISEDYIERPPFIQSGARVKHAAKIFSSDSSLEILIVIDNGVPFGVLPRGKVFEHIASPPNKTPATVGINDLVETPPSISKGADADIICLILDEARTKYGAFVNAAMTYQGWVSLANLTKLALNARHTLATHEVLPASETSLDNDVLMNKFLASLKPEITNVRRLTDNLVEERDAKLTAELASDIHAVLQDVEHQIVGASFLYPSVSEHSRKFTPQELCSFLQASWTVGDGVIRGRPAFRLNDKGDGACLPNASLVRFALEQAVDCLRQIFPNQRQIIQLNINDHEVTAEIKLRGQAADVEKLNKIIAAISSSKFDTKTLLIEGGIKIANLAQTLKFINATTAAPTLTARSWGFNFPATRFKLGTTKAVQRMHMFDSVKALIAAPKDTTSTDLLNHLRGMGWQVDHKTSMIDFGVSVRRNAYQIIICDLDAFGFHESGLEKIIRFQNPINAQTPLIGITDGINQVADRSITPQAIFATPINMTEFVYAALDTVMDQGRETLLQQKTG